MGAAPRLHVAALAAALLSALAAAQPSLDLGPRRDVAPGVALYHLTDPGLVNPPAPISIWMLRVDTTVVDLQAALSNDAIVDTETVADIAARRGAIAAVNGGFFAIPAGDPTGVFKLNGSLVSDTRRPRGAVGIIPEGGAIRLVYGRVTATAAAYVRSRMRPDTRIDIAGVDTTRQRGKVMLFTPAYHVNTDTAPGGLEWIVQGTPLRVAGRPLTAGKTPIPRDGFVLSFGGPRAPPALEELRPNVRVDLDVRYTALEGDARDWERARDIVGGAGLLIRNGVFIDDWSMERLTPGFPETSHPRTLIGTHADRSIWLITVDGRQPKLSVGMTLFELRELARRVGLTDALNLDGGGSTTMWAGGQTMNSPSDAAGPRKVSDALLIMKR